MPKRDDFRPRLAAYVAVCARRNFRPGSHDCALFAAGAVKEMTGQDLARGFRSYRSLKAGRKRLADKGFEDLADFVASKLPEIPPLMAQVGDVAVLEDDNGQTALGIVQGPMIYVLRPSGLGTVPLADAKRAFRV